MQKYHDTIIRSDGRAVGGASVTVTIVGGGTPTLYSDDGVTALGSNVLTTDASGEFNFYAANGRYNFAIAATGLPSENKLDVLLHDPADAAAYLVDAGAYYMPAPGTSSANGTALLAALQSSADVIQFDDGEYTFNATISHSVAGRTIRGKGKERTTLKMDNSHAVDYLFTSSAGASGTVFEDLTFNGNRQNSTNSYCGLLKADHTTVTATFTMRDCIMKNIRLFCVRLYPDSTDITIERNRFESVEDTLFEINPWLRGVLLLNTFIDYAVLPTYAAATGSPLLFYGESDSWQINNNNFYPYATTTGQFAIEAVASGGTGVRGWTVNGNIFDARNALNGDVYGTGISGWFIECAFTGNTWRNGAGSIEACGLEVVGRSNSITGNVCHNGMFSINGSVSTSDPQDTLVANNTFVQNVTSAYPSGRQSDCIRCEDAVGVLIIGNTFRYEPSHIGGGQCVEFAGATADGNMVKDNMCHGGGNTIHGVKLSVSTSGPDNVIEGNYFDTCYRGVNIDGVNVVNTRVARNYFRDSVDVNVYDGGTTTVQTDNVTL